MLELGEHTCFTVSECPSFQTYIVVDAFFQVSERSSTWFDLSVVRVTSTVYSYGLFFGGVSEGGVRLGRVVGVAVAGGGGGRVQCYG